MGQCTAVCVFTGNKRNDKKTNGLVNEWIWIKEGSDETLRNYEDKQLPLPCKQNACLALAL